MTETSDPRSGPPAPPFRVELIGPPRIFTPTGELSPSKPVVFGAALYLLLNRGRMVRRTELAMLLWPDADDSARGERMRWLVSQLKQCGFSVQARTPDITIAASDVVVDAEEVAQAATTQQPSTQRFASVLAAYEPHISDLFSRWLEESRNGLRLELLRRLVPWLAIARRSASWKETEQLARRTARARPEFPLPLEEAEHERALMPRARILAIYAHIALLENDDTTIAALLPRLLECFVPRMVFMEHPAYVAAMCLERTAGWDAAAAFVRRFVDEIRQERWTPRPELTRYLSPPPPAADPR